LTNADRPGGWQQRRGSERGIALVITLIMLSVTLVMALAFLALARRERGSVTTGTDSTTARLAADTALAYAQAQLAANIASGFTGLASSNAYNLHLFVSTNYINPYGFTPGSGNPTNVNYDSAYNPNPDHNPANWDQNIANLWFLPRVPVCVYTNKASPPPLPPTPVYDFRYYLDLNENGAFEPNGWQPVVSDNPTYQLYDTNGNPISAAQAQPPNILSNFFVGDPEWVGVLEHPDAPHGPNNHFISRYAFIAVPAGNALDVNSIHNQARTTSWPKGLDKNDGFLRNQGVGSWELNLAAFLADLNTNVWSPQALPANYYYNYSMPAGQANQGLAFQDAFSLLMVRYQTNSLPHLPSLLPYETSRQLQQSEIDVFSRGPVQSNLDTITPPLVNLGVTPWSGASSTNHYFTPGDFLDGSKLGTFTNDLRYGGTTNMAGYLPSYDRYTFYRMLDELASDSTADDGKLNLNYSNAVVSYYTNIYGIIVPTSVGVVTGAETNQTPWRPQDFFNAAADKLLRMYSTYWFQSNPTNYLITYYGYVPTNYVDATGLGVVNIPYFGVTNQIPSFGITNIPVMMNSNFVYTPAVNRVLQLVANIYDATTNTPSGISPSYMPPYMPHVFRPIFGCVNNVSQDIYIMGYVPVTSVGNSGSIPLDPQLALPLDVRFLSTYAQITGYGQPIVDPRHGHKLVNVYGVPWIIGAKKGLPNFQQFYDVTSVQVTRKLELTRSSLDVTPHTTFGTNVEYVIGPITNGLGVSFWNSYMTNYPRPLRVVVADSLNIFMTNRYNVWPLHTDYTPTNLFANVVINAWPGSQWSGLAPNWLPQTRSFTNFNWSILFQSPLAYQLAQPHTFLPYTYFNTGASNLDQIGLAITNYLQAYILDGNDAEGYNVIDYVQLEAPISVGRLDYAVADPPYVQTGNKYLQWSTNIVSRTNAPSGIANQLFISGHPPEPYGIIPTTEVPLGGQWGPAPAGMGAALSAPDGEAAFFNGFFTGTFQYHGKPYINRQLAIQAPYTPSRTVYSAYLLQANDPLVHYTVSDLNGQYGARSIWGALQSVTNGLWVHSDDPGATQPMPAPPANPLKGRYQPWGQIGQMSALGTAVDQNVYNLSYKDPQIWGPDGWDFPTNLYPTVGWLGRVHRGTPWQTVYLKSSNVVNSAMGITWPAWTGNILQSSNTYYDAANSAPPLDYLLFDVFTTRFNDNAVLGTLPVNVGMGRGDGGLAAWSALFSGMVALTNNSQSPGPGVPFTYGSQIINPAGVAGAGSPLWAIVNGSNGINATRANPIMFPYHAFTRMGNILATPALSVQSPFLNTNLTQRINGINDEMYEWLPQQMMGLVRPTEQRYVLYCWGQSLRPAPNGTVLGGTYSQLVTNYQVVAESAVRAVIRVDGANTSQPHAVVESYNVLPPN
jgi:hypothetical protein